MWVGAVVAVAGATEWVFAYRTPFNLEEALTSPDTSALGDRRQGPPAVQSQAWNPGERGRGDWITAGFDPR